MMKKTGTRWIAAALVAAGLAGTLAGCGASSASASSTVSTKFKGQSLSVFNWPEYIPDEVIQDFEKAYGVTVNTTTYDSNEEMLSKVQSSTAGTYDIVVPSDYMVKVMSSMGLLAKLNKDEIPNLSNMNKQYMNQTFDPGNVYSVPLAPGEIIPCYDTSVLGENAITSLADLLNPKYKGKIVTVDDMKAVIGMTNMSLGYKLNETDPTKLAATSQQMTTKLKPNIYTMTFESAQEHIVSGEVPIGYMFNGNVAMAQQEDQKIVPVWPKEGSYIWVDSFAVLKSSQKQDLANTFINFMLEAKEDAKIRDAIPSTDPNSAGWALVSDKVKSCSALTIPEESWKKGQYAASLDDNTNSLYSKIWTEFTK